MSLCYFVLNFECYLALTPNLIKINSTIKKTSESGFTFQSDGKSSEKKENMSSFSFGNMVFNNKDSSLSPKKTAVSKDDAEKVVRSFSFDVNREETQDEEEPVVISKPSSSSGFTFGDDATTEPSKKKLQKQQSMKVKVFS